MADTPTQKIAALTGEVDKLSGSVNELTRRVELLEEKLDLAVRDSVPVRERLATLEAQAVALQRLSDRGWGLSQAALVVALGAIASAVVQLALRK